MTKAKAEQETISGVERPAGLSSGSSMLSTREAAAFLGMEEATLRSWRCSGIGPPFFQITKGAVRYDRVDLHKYKAERRCVPSVRHTEGHHAALQTTA